MSCNVTIPMTENEANLVIKPNDNNFFTDDYVLIYVTPTNRTEIVHFTLDGSAPDLNSPRYAGPIKVYNNEDTPVTINFLFHDFHKCVCKTYTKVITFNEIPIADFIADHVDDIESYLSNMSRIRVSHGCKEGIESILNPNTSEILAEVEDYIESTLGDNLPSIKQDCYGGAIVSVINTMHSNLLDNIESTLGDKLPAIKSDYYDGAIVSILNIMRSNLLDNIESTLTGTTDITIKPVCGDIESAIGPFIPSFEDVNLQFELRFDFTDGDLLSGSDIYNSIFDRTFRYYGASAHITKIYTSTSSSYTGNYFVNVNGYRIKVPNNPNMENVEHIMDEPDSVIMEGDDITFNWEGPNNAVVGNLEVIIVGRYQDYDLNENPLSIEPLEDIESQLYYIDLIEDMMGTIDLTIDNSYLLNGIDPWLVAYGRNYRYYGAPIEINEIIISLGTPDTSNAGTMLINGTPYLMPSTPNTEISYPVTNEILDNGNRINMMWVENGDGNTDDIQITIKYTYANNNDGLLNIFRTESQGTITPSIITNDSSLVDWDWGDGSITLDNNAPTHTYTDGLSSHDVYIFDINLLSVSELYISNINVSQLNLSSLTQLTTLTCGSNNISTLDVSNNVQLNYLTCGNNNILTLDISNNTQLSTLGIFNNNISTLDISNNTQLTTLICGSNNISTLDVSNNTQLTEIGFLNCSLNSVGIDQILIDLDGHGQINGSLNYQGNPGESNLTACSAYNNLIAKGWSITGQSPVCGTTLFSTESQGTITPSITTSDSSLVDWDWGDESQTFADNNPSHTYIAPFDPFYDVDIFGIDPLIVSVLNIDGDQITDVNLSNLTQLTLLNCGYNNILALDLSNNTQLNELWCYTNNISTLDISNNTLLEVLHCYTNNISTLDISNNTQLTVLSCGDNNLTVLDVSNNTQLNELWCYTNNISTLDISNNTQLTVLTCGANNLTVLDVSNNTLLEVLRCYNNNISTLDISNNTQLTYLSCFNNNISVLDVSNNTQLTVLSCGDNNLTVLDISNNTQLNELWCYTNNISSLDISSNTGLREVQLQNCSLSSSEIDNILIDLDNHGQINGNLNYQGNPGESSLTALTSYNNLLSKGWTITGTTPS